MYRIFVGNLSYSATEDSVRSMFAAYGEEVESVNLIRDRDTGQLRGFGFVEMTNAAEGRKAVGGLNSTDFEGRETEHQRSPPERRSWIWRST